MKALTEAAVATLLTLSASGALAQGGNMMNGTASGCGWMGGGGGGYGGWLVPALLIVLIGVIVWAVVQRRK